MKNLLIVIMSLLILSVCCSGCIENTTSNSTWGEKKISMDAIKMTNITGNRSETNESRYVVSGYISNDNPYEALDLKLRITTFTSNGSVFAVKDDPYIEPKNIPSKGSSYFYASFSDPDKNITRYEVKILSAKGQY